MRIIIETEGQEALAVKSETLAPTVGMPEAIDGGQAPQHLVELLGGEAATGSAESGFFDPLDPENAGEAPTWLKAVVEKTPLN
ncbi:MAG: hypothetical protein WBN65_09400 [Gammaproteobacteria bacterium]